MVVASVLVIGRFPFGEGPRYVHRSPARDLALIWHRQGKSPQDRALTCGDAVGDTGIEPVTSSVSGKRSPAELIARSVLHERVVPRGGNGIRTRVNGFAGRCLASRPSHQEGSQVRKPEPLPSGRWDSNPRPSPWQG